MEGSGQDQVLEMGTSTAPLTSPGGTPVTSRWNPTKEQITMLENLYRQGIRTPTAEQIQEITGRLQAYGHIEGKNVFYWFQNHKARQRQKQKQENNFASAANYNGFHRYLHHHHPVPPLFHPHPHPPFPNAVCGPYYMPQPDLGFYPHQYPKVLLPASGMKKRLPRLEINIPKPINGCAGGMYNYSVSHPGYWSNTNEQVVVNGKHQLLDGHDHGDQETLELFPMHPTGILQARADGNHNSTSTSSSTSNTATTSAAAICMNNLEEEGSGANKLFFDFFSGN